MTSVLCLDIGSGTQDVLLYLPEERLSNCPKFVLPSPAKMVAARIDELASRGRDIYLHGRNMGGGFGGAVRSAIKAGIRVSAHPDAALALSDNPAKLESMGLAVRQERPGDSTGVYCSDFKPGWWEAFLKQAGLPRPDLIAAAVQDHGFHPSGSNRSGRFQLWEKFLTLSEGRPEALVFAFPPSEMTRLEALHQSTGMGPVADTGAAAVLGVLFDPEIERLSFERGITVLNLGNSHTIAFLIYKGMIHGVYEHHTGMLEPDKLMEHMSRFGRGELANEEVFDDMGHGCLALPLPGEAGGFEPLFVIGPRREKLQGRDAAFPNPGGDMMLAGCFGLIKGLELTGMIEPR